MSGIEKIGSATGGIGGGFNSGGCSGIQQTKGTEQACSQEKTKEQEDMAKAEKLAEENDINTLQEALEQKDGNIGVSEGAEGQGSEGAKTIADENDKEVIEKAVEIREQQEAAQKQQAMMAQQQNTVSLSPDAMSGNMGGEGGAIPQSAALMRMI